MKKIKLAAIGCGARTQVYMQLAAQMPGNYEIIAAADPIPERVEKIKGIAKNPDFRSFDSADAILVEDKLADVMIIATQDDYHYEPSKKAMEKGYDILLEKPIATCPRKIIEVEKLALDLKRRVTVCFVLRYTPFYRHVKQIIDSGILGDVITINANEGVVPWHMAHSFVRGHWSVVEECTPMMVSKCCHDTDIISWLLVTYK